MRRLKQLELLLITIMISIFILGQPVWAKSSTSVSSSSRSSSSSVSKTSGSGFKTGSFSSSSITSKSSSTSSTRKSAPVSSSNLKFSTVTSSTKSVNINSKALSSIPSSYSSRSVSNNYYYNVDSGGSSFWSNYWMYRALTPEHRTYISNGSSAIAPSYTGIGSIIPDLITLIIIISIVGITIYIIKRRRD